jgi:hypothetical protein
MGRRLVKNLLPQFKLLHFPPSRRNLPPFSIVVGFTFTFLDLYVYDLFSGSPVIPLVSQFDLPVGSPGNGGILA